MRYRQCAHPATVTAVPPADDDAPEDTRLRDQCAARLRK